MAVSDIITKEQIENMDISKEDKLELIKWIDESEKIDKEAEAIFKKLLSNDGLYNVIENKMKDHKREGQKIARFSYYQTISFLKQYQRMNYNPFFENTYLCVVYYENGEFHPWNIQISKKTTQQNYFIKGTNELINFMINEPKMWVESFIINTTTYYLDNWLNAEPDNLEAYKEFYEL